MKRCLRGESRKMHAAFAGNSLPIQSSLALHQAMGLNVVGTYRSGWKMGGLARWLLVQRCSNGRRRLTHGLMVRNFEEYDK